MPIRWRFETNTFEFWAFFTSRGSWSKKKLGGCASAGEIPLNICCRSDRPTKVEKKEVIKELLLSGGTRWKSRSTHSVAVGVPFSGRTISPGRLDDTRRYTSHFVPNDENPKSINDSIKKKKIKVIELCVFLWHRNHLPFSSNISQNPHYDFLFIRLGSAYCACDMDVSGG